jgi:aryl-alcohol dehydrogenase-like predicted oxidoreductase
MAQSEGMGICAWCALGGGNFKSAEREALQSDGNPGRKLAPPSLIDITIFEALERIAKRYNTSLTAVAFAYVMLKAPYSYPIPGGRKVEHLKGNIAALEIALTTEDIEGIEGAAPIHTGFPMNFLTQGQAKEVGPASILFTKMAGHFDSLKAPVAIRPKKE